MNKRKLKKIILPAALLLIIGTAIILFKQNTAVEPLSANDILKKDKWTREELESTLGRAFAPQGNRVKRKEVLLHLRKQLAAYPEDEQNKIRIAAMAKSVSSSLDQMRALPEHDRRKMTEGINQSAEKNFEALNRMTPQEREKIKSQLDSPEGRALVDEINRVSNAKMTPDERRDLAPAINYWVRSLRSL
ncbi:MAG: hypothetical protein AB7F32_11295 [Victivallaceae bacterium]